MTNPTRQEIIDAYKTLDLLLGFSEDRNPDLVPERRRIIEKALPPRPQPTMAEIEWDNDAHYLAEAERAGWGKVTMLWVSTIGNISVIGDGLIKDVRAEDLTPTGRRYTLTEVQE